MTVLDVSQGQWFVLADVEVNNQHFFAATMALPMRRQGQQSTIVYIQSRATDHSPAQESSHLVENYGAATLLVAEHYKVWLEACNT